MDARVGEWVLVKMLNQRTDIIINMIASLKKSSISTFHRQ